MSTPQATATPEAPRLTFDNAVCERLRTAFQDVFLKFPEVKCLAASITWNGNLNDAQIMHGIWLGPDGPVKTPDGVVGSVYQTMRMLDEQFGRGMQLADYLKDQVTVLSTELSGTYEKIEKAKAELAALGQKVRADGGGAGNP